MSDRPPAGSVLAHVSVNGRGYCLTETESAYIVRHYLACEFTIDKGLRTIEVGPDPTITPGLASLLLGGGVLATLLILKGECVLHASAVDLDGSVIAFVGSSGMGKSTIAALLCAEGASLVTDDVLRVSNVNGQLTCSPGSWEIRLRREAAPLAGMLAGICNPTVDGRMAVVLPRNRPPSSRLTAIVIPQPDRRLGALHLERMHRSQAMIHLSRYPRILGWRESTVLRRQFTSLARIASEVPVFAAAVPWGPPFPPGLTASLAEGIGMRSNRSRGALGEPR